MSKHLSANRNDFPYSFMGQLRFFENLRNNLRVETG